MGISSLLFLGVMVVGNDCVVTTNHSGLYDNSEHYVQSNKLDNDNM